MNPNLTAIITFAVGSVLMYSAVKNKDPRDVFKEAVGQGKAKPKVPDYTTSPPNTSQPSSYNPHGSYYSPGIPV